MKKVAVEVKNIYEIIKVKKNVPHCGGYDSYSIYLVQLAIIPVHPQFVRRSTGDSNFGYFYISQVLEARQFLIYVEVILTFELKFDTTKCWI